MAEVAKIFLSRECKGHNVHPFAWVKGLNYITTNTTSITNDITQQCIDLYNSSTTCVSPALRTKHGEKIDSTVFKLSFTTPHLSSPQAHANVLQLSAPTAIKEVATELLRELAPIHQLVFRNIPICDQ